jgi:hypothetical protein
LNYDAGVFWVLIRVLASGGIGVLVWEGVTGQLAKRNEIEVRVCCFSVVDTTALIMDDGYRSGRPWVLHLYCNLYDTDVFSSLCIDFRLLGNSSL